MQRLIVISFIIFTSALSSLSAQTAKPMIEMQNMHLTMDVYLSNQPRNRGLSAAAWLRFRNNESTPLSSVTLLLNPGFKVTKIVGTKNRTLRYDTSSRQIEGGGPQLKIITVALAAPVKSGDSAEFSVQYQGDLTSLAAYGDAWPVDTLNPKFTMIRPESFVYPILSEPSAVAFNQYREQQHFAPTARITLPQGYSLGGNANEASRTLKGTREEIELRTVGKAYGLVVGLGQYKKHIEGPLKLFYLPENETNALAMVATAKKKLAALETKLGVIDPKKAYIVSDVASAFEAPNGSNHWFASFGDYSSVPLESALPPLWAIQNYTSNIGGWHVAITNFAGANTSDPDQIFVEMKQFLMNEERTQKMALLEYGSNGFASASTTGYQLLFVALKDLVGADEFWRLIYSFRETYVDFGASDEDLLEHLKNNLKNRKARKLVIDWIDKGRLDRDLKASDNFKALIERYS